MKKDHFTIKTLKQAKRLIMTVFGFTVVMLGTAMLFLPGPGLATIVAGLAILATEFVWARKLLKRFGDEAHSFKDLILNSFNRRKGKV